ncbi:hypothetical protein [Mycobacterium sp. C31M]
MFDYLAIPESTRAQQDLATINPAGTCKSHTLPGQTTAVSMLDRSPHHTAVVVTDGNQESR